MATDVQNDLHTPIMPRAKLGERLSGTLLPKLSQAVKLFTRIGGAVLGVLLLLLGGWIFFTDTPLGGEPQAQSPIQIAATPASDSSTGTYLQPLPPQAAPVAGQPRVLQVPTAQIADQRAETADPSVPQPTVPSGLEGPRFDGRGGLPGTANASLVERFDAASFVPALGANGERPLDVYARPLEAGTVVPGQPRIALIVGGMGLSQTSTQAVIGRLPPATSLSFAPYGSSLSRWASRARQAGHEYLIEVPMEPFDYPNNDPGPHTLQVSLEPQANLERMHWALSRLPTPVGMINYMGARFASEDAAFSPVLRDALGRGLMVVDDARSARSRLVDIAPPDAPALRADVVIDARADSEAINNRLAQLESIARENGSALGVATALPLTINILEEWTASLATKGIALVPVSSLVRF